MKPSKLQQAAHSAQQENAAAGIRRAVQCPVLQPAVHLLRLTLLKRMSKAALGMGPPYSLGARRPAYLKYLNTLCRGAVPGTG